MTLAKKPLTDRAIASAAPAAPGKRRLLWDAIVPGLALRVTNRGARSFVLVTRYPGSLNPAPAALDLSARSPWHKPETRHGNGSR